MVAWDGSRYLHIIGTQDNARMSDTTPPFPVDLLKFQYDTVTGDIIGPTVLLTASYIKEGYDLCVTDTGTFVVAAVVNPVTVDGILTVAEITSITVSGNILYVTAANQFQAGMAVTFSGVQLATFLNGITLTVNSANSSSFTAGYSHADWSAPSASPPVYESGFATWLPGNSLIGFDLDGLDVVQALPYVFQNSPLRGGNVYGSASTIFSNEGIIEVYWERHPDISNFTDLTFQVVEVKGTPILSPPYISWGGAGVLTSFTGRYTDNRLTVLPYGDARVASLVYFSQNSQTGVSIGNIIIGYNDGVLSPPASWRWKTSTGSSLGGSVTQATISYPQSVGPSVSFLLGGVLYTGDLDLASLGITSPVPEQTSLIYPLTWMRGTKSTLDDLSAWAVVGESSIPILSPPYVAATPYYISGFDVPPTAELIPISGTVLRGTPFSFDASGSFDPDGDPILFSWTAYPINPHVVLSTNGPQATINVSRAIGGAALQFSVSVIAVDYTGGNPDHPPIQVTGVSYNHASNTATVLAAPVNLVAGMPVLLFGLQNAIFLNNAIVTVTSTGTSMSPPSAEFSGTVQFSTPQQVRNSDYPLSPETGSAITEPQYAVTQYDGLSIAYNAPPVITMPPAPTVPRNVSYTISPVITGATDPDDATVYTWVQLAGTTMQTMGLNGPTLTFSTSGASVEGEVLEFELTVNDGVNAPVSAEIVVYIPSYDFSTFDTRYISRSNWNGDVQSRNTVTSPPTMWSPPNDSFVLSNFTDVKRASVLNPAYFSNDRYIVISPYSVTVYLEDQPTSPPAGLLRKLLLPQPVSPPAWRP